MDDSMDSRLWSIPAGTRSLTALLDIRNVVSGLATTGARLGLVMLCIAFVATPRLVRADTLSTLRARLAGFPDDSVISGVLTVARNSINGKGPHAEQTHARVQISVTAKRGISLDVPGSVLARVTGEMDAARTDPKLSTPTADLFASIGPLQVERMLDAASTLRLALADAKLIRESPGQLEGTEFEKLQLLLPLRTNKSDRSKVKKYSSHMTLWLSRHGIPVGYTLTTVTEVGWLFLNIDLDRTESVSLTDTGSRLIATTYIASQRTSGLGQHTKTTTTYTLQLLPTQNASARQRLGRSGAS